MKALKLLYIDKKWIEEECDISKIPIERVQTTIKDLVEINEAIAELEALQQPKSCDGCKHYNFTYSHQDGVVRKFEVMCSDCIRTNTKDRYEAKEQ